MNARFMFRPSDILIDGFVDHLRDEYARNFPDGAPAHGHAIERAEIGRAHV